MKANNHPLVKDLRAILTKHKLDGAVLVAIKSDGHPIAVSAGTTVAKCNALGPILKSDFVEALFYEIDVALSGAELTEEDIKTANPKWSLLPLGEVRPCASQGCETDAAYELDAAGVRSMFCGACKNQIEKIIDIERHERVSK